MRKIEEKKSFILSYHNAKVWSLVVNFFEKKIIKDRLTEDIDP